MGDLGEDLSSLPRGAEKPQEACCCSKQPSEARKANRPSLQVAQGSGREAMCEQHQEPRKLFCHEDRALICIICDKSRKHRAHLVLPIEEAAQDYKKEIEAKLLNVKMERICVKGLKLTRERKTAGYLEVIKAEREKIVLAFQQLHLFLEEEENDLLAHLDEEAKQMEKEQEEMNIELSSTISVLDDLVSDLEKDCQRPASEFLQNLKESLSRCEKGKLHWPVEEPPNLEKKISAISQKSIVLTENLTKLKGILAVELKTQGTPCLNAVLAERREETGLFWPVADRDGPRKVSVRLDPQTASPKLLISLDQKTVRHWNQPQMLPDNPSRFDPEPFVLGCEGFCLGKHCWVVNVEQGQSWAVGVARESVQRKGCFSLCPEQGIWAVEQCWGQFRALTARWTSLPLVRKLQRIQVSLDYEQGWLAFSDADLEAPVFTFPPISFKRERIYPWLWVGPGSHLSLCH